jgi:hypothetical protein
LTESYKKEIAINPGQKMKKRDGRQFRDSLRYRVLLILLVAALLSTPVFAQVTGQFTNDPDLYFTGSSSDPGTLYQDAIDGNQDVGIQLCGVGQRYVGAFYALQVSGSWRYVLLSYNSFANALALTDADAGGGCYKVTEGFVTVSPSELTTPSPNVKKAAFPGKLYIGYGASANPGTVSNFIYGGTTATLLGDYSVQRSFDQSTRQIAVQSPTITFQTSSMSFAKSGGDASFGISGERRAVIGVCDDTEGQVCSDGNVFSSAAFPALFNSGLAVDEVHDKITHSKYVVINGIGKQICIGANLRASIASLVPDPVYYSMNLSVNYTISNPRDAPFEIYGGNVQVTSPFKINISIYNTSAPTAVIMSTVIDITDSISPDGSVSRLLVWPAYAHSGRYTIRVTADPTNAITECNEADNYATANFELKPITLPEIYIDGNRTNVFRYPNTPYNLSFYFKNSDNDTLRNANVSIVQVNGLMLAAPVQTYNRSIGVNTTTQDGLVTESIVKFKTDYNGLASMAYIPTYNKLYQEQYSYLALLNHVGNYSMYFEGVQADGEHFKFVLAGNLSSTYPLLIGDTSYTGTLPDKTVPYQTMAAQVMDYIYQSFANFLDTLLG